MYLLYHINEANLFWNENMTRESIQSFYGKQKTLLLGGIHYYLPWVLESVIELIHSVDIYIPLNRKPSYLTYRL